MFDRLDVSKVTGLHPANMDWEFVKRLRDTVSVKLLIKGIVTREDAQMATRRRGRAGDAAPRTEDDYAAGGDDVGG